MGGIVQTKLSEREAKWLLLGSAMRSNILPITSICNIRCKFCSHNQNPLSVETRRMPPISMDLINEAISFMDPLKPVVIGESVTRLIEGEPFFHPRIREILKVIREKMPDTVIKLTTNGTMLERETVDYLVKIGSIEICLSLNSCDVSVRRYLMNDKRAETAVSAAALLNERGIVYHGSIVAMPHITGWGDLGATIKFFDSHGAVTVRVFVPGYTSLTPPELMLPQNLREQLQAYIAGIKSDVKVPVTLDPPIIRNLNAEVAGVILETPAQRAGIIVGDIILNIDGQVVGSRVEAYKKVLALKNPSLEILRHGQKKMIAIVKKAGSPSGLVFDYDIDPATIKEIEMGVNRRRSMNPVLLTSELGYAAVKMGISRFINKNTKKILIKPVKNRYFGGSIGCAGLLTVEDMLKVLPECPEETDLVIIPGIAFDHKGRDITGRSYLDMKLNKAVKLEVI